MLLPTLLGVSGGKMDTSNSRGQPHHGSHQLPHEPHRPLSCPHAALETELKFELNVLNVKNNKFLSPHTNPPKMQNISTFILITCLASIILDLVD